MRILTATKMLGVLFIVLSATKLFMVIGMNRSLETERNHVSRNLEFNALAEALEDASGLLTTEARAFTISGNRKHFDSYWREVRETKTREKVIAKIREMGAAKNEIHLLEKAKANSDTLIRIEEKAMSLAINGEYETAQKLMFSADYDASKASIIRPIQEFLRAVGEDLAKKQAVAHQRSILMMKLVNLVMAIFAVSAVSSVYFLVIRGIGRPLASIVDAMNEISSGAVLVEIPYVDQNNEIGELAAAAKVFQESLDANRQLTEELRQQEEHLEAEVKERTAELTEANDELEEFAYRTSHDLRSPLISSIKLLSIAADSVDSGKKEKAMTCISHARSSLKKLNELTEDILVLAKAKNGQEESQEVLYSAIVDEALGKFDHMENFSRIKIQKDYKFSKPLLLKKTRLTLVIENLLSNAIKYCDVDREESFIRIATREEGGVFTLEISDNGIGIPADQQDRLFTMFKRFHPSVSFGSGLGLYLIRKSVDVMGGKIAFEDLDGGSLFRLSIPIK